MAGLVRAIHVFLMGRVERRKSFAEARFARLDPGIRRDDGCECGAACTDYFSEFGCKKQDVDGPDKPGHDGPGFAMEKSLMKARFRAAGLPGRARQ
jgi:hypothetical protein